MDTSKYNREIRLACPACGGTQFEYDETVDFDDQIVKCGRCNRETTKQALIDENSENINGHVEEIGDEVVNDIAKELDKTLKKVFR